MEIKIPDPDFPRCRQTEKVVREPVPFRYGCVVWQLFDKGVMQETDISKCTCGAGRFISGI